MNITKYEQIGKCFKKYKRPDLKFSHTDQDLHLMATDFHNYTEEVQQGKTRSVMLINCLDKNENTFLVQVNNFNTYFYVLCPENLEEPAQKDFFKAIENHINKISQKKVVESITLVFKESFLEYKVKEKEIKYLKIVLNDYEAMSKIKSSFEKGIELSNRNYQSANVRNECKLFIAVFDQ
jgi:DNA polymerase elongation subunit (family B)